MWLKGVILYKHIVYILSIPVVTNTNNDEIIDAKHRNLTCGSKIQSHALALYGQTMQHTACSCMCIWLTN